MNEQPDRTEVFVRQAVSEAEEKLAGEEFFGTEERISIGPRASYFGVGFVCGFLSCLFFLVMAILG